MPVLSSERRDAPRSSLRHRPIETGDTPPDPTTLRQRRSPVGAPVTTRLSKPGASEAEKGEIVVPHRRRIHPLFFVGVGLMLAVLLWTGLGQALVWGNNELSTLRYGYPRSYQTDAFVNLGDSVQHPSHFVALNLHGVVTILDFPGSAPNHVMVITSTRVPGTDADLAVVILHFLDINQDGRSDMLVNIGGLQSFLVNDGQSFRPPTLAEQQQFIQYMRNHPQADDGG